ncbi:hypothetical protein BDZ89DRAFT_1061526 [Hymenopellis radicata]|nr:hypothetical protein BDZ89DRAFT_1061526 [Hymenopellis radicata]
MACVRWVSRRHVEFNSLLGVETSRDLRAEEPLVVTAPDACLSSSATASITPWLWSRVARKRCLSRRSNGMS